MANQTRLTQWVLKHKTMLNPSFTEFNWPTRYFNGLSDFEAVLSIDGLTAIGRGIDANKELAIEKASSEAIERLICQRLCISSVGVAISGEVSSETHAQCEALERYYFDEHIKLNQPFILIKSKSTEKLINQFKKQNDNATLEFYKMATPAPSFGIVCKISCEQKNPLLGLSLDTDFERALNKSLNEALVKYARLMDSPGTFHQEINANKDMWLCDTVFLNSIESLFNNQAKDSSLISLPALSIKKLDISSIRELEGCPIDPIHISAFRGNS